ncbi:hypothetical protein VNO78_07769 [Psophocarpus tetragonolobus]|uniref:Uncharacterized protein n=1 Tax=Psophocarpus tetragonolobus TaxID=3891 RepID=A0AAN9XSQ6_PSOTE
MVPADFDDGGHISSAYSLRIAPLEISLFSVFEVSLTVTASAIPSFLSSPNSCGRNAETPNEIGSSRTLGTALCTSPYLCGRGAEASECWAQNFGVDLSTLLWAKLARAGPFDSMLYLAYSFDRMLEIKPVVGLSWQPQLPNPLSLKAIDVSNPKPQAVASNSTVWKSNYELVNGLFVPPNDPRKLNKLLRKQV